VWINPDDLSGFQGIIGNWVSPEDGRSYIGLNGTSYNWDGYSTSSNNRGTATALVWQMLTVTRTGLTVTILSNGVQQGATIVDNGTPNVLHNTFIGALTEGTSNFYDGLIGDNFLSNTYRNNDYMLDLFTNQSDPDNFGTSSEYILVGGSGITLAVTEALNSFSDSSATDIDYNVTITTTESFNSFQDISVLSVTGGYSVSIDVTETFNPFIDSSVLNLSANINALVTEVLNSFLDSSNATIAKDLQAQVTEAFNSFNDNSFLRLPTNWNDKPVAVTNYTTQTPVNTIWTDKG
jgi:hypothetical protein